MHALYQRYSQCCAHNRMTTRERLFLSPWEKLRTYGVVPWKLLLNLSLVVLVTTQVLVMNAQETAYVQAASRNFYFYFFPVGYDFTDIVTYTNTINDTVDAVQHAVESYYSINDVSLDSFGYNWVPSIANSSLFVPQAPVLTVTSFADTETLFNGDERFDPAMQTASFSLNTSYFGPVDYNVGSDSLRQFFNAMVSMTLDLPPLHNFAFGSLYRNCMTWSISVLFDFSARGQVALTMEQTVTGTCDEYPSIAAQWADKGLWVNVIVIAVSILHSALLVRAMARSFRLLRGLKDWARKQAARLGAFADGAHGALPEGSVPLAPKLCINISTDGTDGEGDLFVTATSSHAVGASSAGVAMAAINTVAVFATGDDADTELVAGAGGSSINRRRTAGSSLSNVISGSWLHHDAQEPIVSGAHNNLISMKEGLLQHPEEAVRGTDTNSIRGSIQASVLGGADAANSSLSASAFDSDATAAAAALKEACSSLTWRDQLRFINGWSALSVTADVCNIASSVGNLANPTAHLPSDSFHCVLMGTGLALLWVGVIRFLEQNRTYFNVILTLRRAGPRVLRFLVGVAPIFVAYGLFAVVMFADRVPRFADAHTAFMTLFSNMNGDVVRETFMAIVPYHPVVGQIFFYSFISLHIYVLLNIVIAVVEESYFITLSKSQEVAEAKAKAKAEQDSSRAASAASNGASEAAAAAPTTRATTIDLLRSAAKSDSNSVKFRPHNQLTVLLRLSEWDEVRSGRSIIR